MELARLGMRIEEFYGMPMDVEWTWTLPAPAGSPTGVLRERARGEGGFAVVQARPITALPPEWKVEPKTVYGRGSLAEHTPSPVTPLFATLGMEIANRATEAMWDRVFGEKAKQKIRTSEGAYAVINGYVYGGFRMDAKAMGVILRVSFSQLAPIFRGSVARWQAAREELDAVVEAWEQKTVEAIPPSGLLEGVHTVFGAACRYFTVIQTCLPAASMSEVFFTRLYNSLIKRKGDPEATVFVLGSETVATRGEKSLFDIATWLKSDPALADYVLQAPTDQLLADLKQQSPPQSFSADLWNEWQRRFQKHLDEFGRTAYEFDFANPTPAETPGPLLDTLRAFLEGKAHNPYERQRQAITKREQATQSVLKRIGWPRKGWFEKLLHWAQDTGPMRENSIFDMGMGHPLIRRMLNELGRRFVAGGAIESADDIYWLEKPEVEALIAALENGKPLPDLAERIPTRKAEWQSFLKITPPVLLPEKTGWNKLVHGDEAERKMERSS
jgi:pyruvate,water dikinase